jgi:hypothetical protein
MGMSGSVTPRPRFATGKGPSIPIVQEAGWTQELVQTQRLEEKSFAPAGDLTPVAQSVVRHYTNWTTPAPNNNNKNNNMNITLLSYQQV